MEEEEDDDTISYVEAGVDAGVVEARDIQSLDFLVRCPPEIAWHVLGYWRCQYPADMHVLAACGTYWIDHLGFH